MDGEAGWWTASGNIGLPPLARVMGVGRQQQPRAYKQEKKEAMAEKKRENELAEKDDAVILLYIALQKVPLSPSLQASACYYKSKLDLFT